MTKQYFHILLLVWLGISAFASCGTNSNKGEDADVIHPRAISMWDFSWLERRWPGAGYEDWDEALDEFVDRGYNALRIEAYPQLVAADPEGEWVLEEVWNQQDWGSPDMNKVRVQPELNEFLSKCRDRDIKVGLSSWCRVDTTHQEMKIKTPEDLGEVWVKTLKTIEDAGLLDVILYVDLCNEWPGDLWAPYFHEQHPEIWWGYWESATSEDWMERSIDVVRKQYPDIPLIFSFDSQDVNKYKTSRTDFLDFFEVHSWMVQQNNFEFQNAMEYANGRFDPQAYKNVVKNAQRLYDEKPEYWNKLILDQIHAWAEMSRQTGKPLITTECWAIIDYKDWPLLSWDWVKEVCGNAVEEAASTGQWAAIATSNFCGPQFVGMWRDVEWHRHLTSVIKNSVLDESLLKDNPEAMKLLKRL